MIPEVSLTALTVLKMFKGLVYSFTKLLVCDHVSKNPSKVFNLKTQLIGKASSAVIQKRKSRKPTPPK